LLAYAEFLRDLERVGGTLAEAFDNSSSDRVLNYLENAV
jgi:hypothetical protein